MNFWGVAPSNVPPWINSSPCDTPGQLGAVTNSVLQVGSLLSVFTGSVGLSLKMMESDIITSS